MAGKKKRGRKKKVQYDFSQGLIGIALLALTMYTGWIIVQQSSLEVEKIGFVGTFIFRTMSSLAGDGKIIFPFLFCIAGLFCVVNKKMENRQLLGFVIGVLAVLTFLHMDLTFGTNSLVLGWSGLGGGIIGAVCAWLLSKALGEVGSYIVLFCLAIVAVMLISQNAVAQKGDAWLEQAKNLWQRLKEALFNFIFIEEEESKKKKEEKQKVEQLALDYKEEQHGLQKSKREKPLIINNLTEIQKTIEETKNNQVETEQEDEPPIITAQPEAAPIIKVAAPTESVSAKRKKKEEEQPETFTVDQQTLIEQDEKAYQYPSIDLLEENNQSNENNNQDEINQRVAVLEQTLADFGVKGHITEVSIGPAITQYEFQPAAGVKVSKIVNLSDDIALSMATAGVRIEAPIPGKAAVGIEIPNKQRGMVSLREVIDSPEFQDSDSKLTVALGKDISGKPIVADLGKMPHLLIAGSTGSGKSVCMNALINSILFKAAPNEVKLLMVDPKMVELGNYNGIPHLISPVVTDPKKAAAALRWAVREMERRYALFAENNVKDMKRFNALSQKRLEQAATEEERAAIEVMPYIVVLIDELADLMMVAPADVEDAICRLAQLARAAGIHLVVATQRPSVDVITGIIKANLPSRIAFAVSSQIDSRTILDMGGAEKLLGKGDMLFYPTGLPKPVRVQGVYVSDQEIDKIVEATKQQGEPVYDEEIAAAELTSTEKNDGNSSEETDPLIPEAIKLFIENGQASISLLQRRFRVGYNRAARIIDQMEQLGLIGPYEGSKPRQVKITMEEYLQQQENV